MNTSNEYTIRDITIKTSSEWITEVMSQVAKESQQDGIYSHQDDTPCTIFMALKKKNFKKKKKLKLKK